MANETYPLSDEQARDAITGWVHDVSEVAETVPADMQTPLRHVRAYERGDLTENELQDRFNEWQAQSALAELMEIAERDVGYYIDE